MSPVPGGPPSRLVSLGASWGGLDALTVVLGALPADLPAPVVVVQHRSPQAHSSSLVNLLATRSALVVVEADDKMPIEPGHVYVAPPDYHLLVETGSLALSTDELVRYSRPSVDVLFESAADAYGAGVIGVVLTGANDDGARGLSRIRRLGGVGVVQDPATAERREMPEAAIAAGADHVVPLPEIAPLLVALCTEEPVGRRRG